MASYGAMQSLMHTLNNVLHCSRFSLDGRDQLIIQVVINELQPWRKILERLDSTSPSRSRKKVNALDGRIKEAIWKFEDSLESLLIQQIPSQLETLPEIVPIDIQSLQNEVHSLIETLKDMKKDYIYEVKNMPQDGPIATLIGFHGTNSKMIGLSDQFQQLKTHLIVARNGKPIGFYAVIGMAGIGKTTLAMKMYQDPQIHRKFECRAWVTVGRVHQPLSQILRGILSQLCGITQGAEEIESNLRERFHGKNCLIVLDDVWETTVAGNILKYFYENIQNGCIQLLVTGRHRILINACVLSDFWYEMRFLNEEESMELLCEKVFGDEICPPQLHKAAIKVAKYCEGLPLLIVTVAAIISISEHKRDLVYWNDVAERRNTVFRDAYNKILEVLFPSYDCLLQRHKMPFLCMGVFPRDYNTPTSKIIIMLMAQGLLSSNQWERIFLKELAYDYSLVLRNRKSANKTDVEFNLEEYKTCRLHSSWQHACREEASKNKLYHVLNTLNDASEECLKGQRGLCLENNILFGIKEFCVSVRFNCASYVRSLLFYGPYHRYPIAIDVDFMLLRELNALNHRFYTFPIEILTLVQLRYLALTCNGEVPTTISKLFNLRVLIMHPHMNIRRRGAPSYVPVQIWDMQVLEHIEILGKFLVAPSHVVSSENLSTLVGVNPSICKIFNLSQRIPKIKKLGIQIELAPYDDHNDLLSCLGIISKLDSLETLKLSIKNPIIKNGNVFPVNHGMLKLPRNLKKLHLTGMGFPWKYMDVIGSLLSLEVLKLRSYAFRGSRWETKKESFQRLKFLLIEESDLVQWKPGHRSLPELQYLSVKHCYKLEDIGRPSSLDQYFHTIEIELEDCNPLSFTSASQLQPGVGGTVRVTASSSFYEKPTTFKCERCGGRQDFKSGVEGDDGESTSDHEDTELENDEEYTSNHKDKEEEGDNAGEISNRGEDDEGKGTDEENDDEYMDDHEENEEEYDGDYTYDHEDTEVTTNVKEHESFCSDFFEFCAIE